MNTDVPSSQTWWKSAGRLESHHGPIGPGRGSFCGSSTLRLLHDVGSTGAACRKATREVAEEAERGNFWLWLRRKHKGRGPSKTQGISRGWQGGGPVIALPPGDVLGSEEQHIHTHSDWWSPADEQIRPTEAPVEVLQSQQVRPSPWIFTRTLEDSTCSIKT